MPPREEAPAPVESLPFTIPIPDAVACTLDDTSKSPPSVELGLSRKGPAFGSVRPRLLIARVGVGQSEILVDAEATGIRLRAIAVGDSLSLYPSRAAMFEGFVVPVYHAELTLVAGVDGGGVEVSLALPKQIVVAKRRAVSETLPCAGVRLQAVDFDPMSVVGTRVATAYLSRQPTPLTRTSDGKAIATLHAKSADPEVTILDRKENRTMIAWPVGAVIAVGWVDKKLLRPTPPDGDDDFGAGGLGLTGIGEGGRRSFRCTGDVQLRAEVGKKTEVIGMILPGTPIVIEKERDGAFEVDLPSTGLSKHEKAVLVVDKHQMGSCRE